MAAVTSCETLYTNKDRLIVLKRMFPVAPLSSVSPAFRVSLISPLSPVSTMSLVSPVSLVWVLCPLCPLRSLYPLCLLWVLCPVYPPCAPRVRCFSLCPLWLLRPLWLLSPLRSRWPMCPVSHCCIYVPGEGKLVRISSDGYDRRSIYGFEIFDFWIFLLRKLKSYVFRY